MNERNTEKKIFLSTVHDYFHMWNFFLSFFATDFPRILNFFPYFLFLIAATPKIIFAN
jgi:hypothetical protein